MPTQLSKGGYRNGESGPAGLTADEVYDLLSNQRRRFVLYHLREAGETVLRELSLHIAAWENDVEPEMVTAIQRKRVYTALHQTHLGRLDDLGVVEYDRSRGTIRPTERLDIFDPHLREVGSSREPWYRNSSLTSLGIGAVVVAGVLGAPVLAGLDAAFLLFGLASFLLGLAYATAMSPDKNRLSGAYPGLIPSEPTTDADDS